jgi:hypothetical protein
MPSNRTLMSVLLTTPTPTSTPHISISQPYSQHKWSPSPTKHTVTKVVGPVRLPPQPVAIYGTQQSAKAENSWHKCPGQISMPAKPSLFPQTPSRVHGDTFHNPKLNYNTHRPLTHKQRRRPSPMGLLLLRRHYRLLQPRDGRILGCRRSFQTHGQARSKG